MPVPSGENALDGDHAVEKSLSLLWLRCGRISAGLGHENGESEPASCLRTVTRHARQQSGGRAAGCIVRAAAGCGRATGAAVTGGGVLSPYTAECPGSTGLSD
ncbi:hypothetical protein Xvie_02611 [Xenorhabdus vietnamensis]|uniref:Uncharacterized protein n=1 Tax=Xenorhabdus vietnamensis TaxID=351656 RepID=A0A1Y2SC54_9GAMM|nr:hypothetical protein Xvie_02611 [Xenorhabdus vietnamensis]